MQHINEATPSLLEILYIDLQSKDERDFSNKITSIFALDIKQTQNKLNLYSVFKKDLNQALYKFCFDHHWTDPYSQLLSRVFDYVKRDEAK